MAEALSAIGATLMRNINSTIVQCVGDSTTYGTYSWPAQSLDALAERFPDYSLRLVQWYQASSADPLNATNGYRTYRTMRAGVRGDRATRYSAGTPSAGPHSTPCAPALTSTDIDVRVEIALADYATGASQVLVSRWGPSASNGRQFWCGFAADGSMRSQVSVDGVGTETAVSSSVVPALADGSRQWLRWTIQTNSGGARLFKFFTGVRSGSDNIAWTQVGVDRTAVGTAALNPTCSSPLMFGGRHVSTMYQEKPIGDVFWVDVRSGGIATGMGEIVCPPLLERWDYFLNPQDDNVSQIGSPAIILYGGGLPGQQTDIFSHATIFSKLHAFGVRPDEFWLNTGHNEGDATSQDWADRIDAYLDAIEARYAPLRQVSFVSAAQNPVVPAHQKTPPLEFGFSPQAIQKRERRNQVMRHVVAARGGWKMVDSRGAFFTDDNRIRDPRFWNSDGLHPSSGADGGPSGGKEQGAFIARQLFADVMGRPVALTRNPLRKRWLSQHP
ncbi:MAG: SGNH/GDSL hydrolase family protein [Nocardioides sp.]